MATLIIRILDDKYSRLKGLASRRKISVNKLLEELLTLALSEFDSETRFRAMATRGSLEKGLEVLNKLDAHRGA